MYLFAIFGPFIHAFTLTKINLNGLALCKLFMSQNIGRDLLMHQCKNTPIMMLNEHLVCFNLCIESSKIHVGSVTWTQFLISL